MSKTEGQKEGRISRGNRDFSSQWWGGGLSGDGERHHFIRNSSPRAADPKQTFSERVKTEKRKGLLFLPEPEKKHREGKLTLSEKGLSILEKGGRERRITLVGPSEG